MTSSRRDQPTQIGLGGSATNTSLLKLNYDYGTAQNNGNVLSQTITVPTAGANAGFTAAQTYTYDSLNRLKSATENIDGNQTPSWKQTYTFDRYGNRRFDVANTTTIPAGCAEAVCNPQIDPATNKLIGYQFDNAGNTKIDANGQVFTYDAENKQVAVTNGGGIVGEYFYDGDGKRVKKVVPNGETTIFVYDAGGKTVAEYSTVVEPTSNAKISYLTNDHLGSPRITTDAAGQVISRRDFRPFGEEIARANYGTDAVRKKFTGYERDNETQLDFAQARYHDFGLGRFSTCDPVYISDEHPANPQKWNLYVYVVNSPLRFTDPKGLKPKVIDIFITISQAERDENGAKKDWYALAKSAPKGTKVNIYTVDDGTATVEQFAKSLKSSGRTVIVFGHSTAKPEDQKQADQGGTLIGQGLKFSNGESVGGTLINTDTEKLVSVNNIKASGIALFTCRSGNTVNELMSQMNGGGLIVNNGGADGKSKIHAQEDAAYAATKL